MKKTFERLLFALLAVAVALSLTVFALADNESAESADVSTESVVSEVSQEASAEDVTSTDDASDAASEATSEDASAAVSGDTSAATSEVSSAGSADNTDTQPQSVSTFPWPRVIALIVIVVLIAGAFILAKTNTKLGQKLNKWFKDYKSEIKKIVWFKGKDLVKATGVVLVFVIGAAILIGLLDLGFTKLIELLATIF